MIERLALLYSDGSFGVLAEPTNPSRATDEAILADVNETDPRNFTKVARVRLEGDRDPARPHAGTGACRGVHRLRPTAAAQGGVIMIVPVRLQLSRRAGFNLQAVSRAANGLPAVNVARPSGHGNPFRVGQHGTQQECVDRFRRCWEETLRSASTPPRHPPMPFGHPIYLGSLMGRNLACWCHLCAAHAAGRPLGVACTACDPCHVDVLLPLANPEAAQNCAGAA